MSALPNPSMMNPTQSSSHNRRGGMNNGRGGEGARGGRSNPYVMKRK